MNKELGLGIIVFVLVMPAIIKVVRRVAFKKRTAKIERAYETKMLNLRN